MKSIALLFAAAMALAPAAALACAMHSSQMKSSSLCPAGQTWDAATQSCTGTSS
ncbi:MAG: hypothetical protein KGK00_05580 [Paracoccaceae bacterium]|nr:hypothetical protein [Paracoccaceae bacterium]MDE3237412.1 hypothetical protein [Paracoccaceae bacterium]